MSRTLSSPSFVNQPAGARGPVLVAALLFLVWSGPAIGQGSEMRMPVHSVSKISLEAIEASMTVQETSSPPLSVSALGLLGHVAPGGLTVEPLLCDTKPNTSMEDAWKFALDCERIDVLKITEMRLTSDVVATKSGKIVAAGMRVEAGVAVPTMIQWDPRLATIETEVIDDSGAPYRDGALSSGSDWMVLGSYSYDDGGVQMFFFDEEGDSPTKGPLLAAGDVADPERYASFDLDAVAEADEDLLAVALQIDSAFESRLDFRIYRLDEDRTTATELDSVTLSLLDLNTPGGLPLSIEPLDDYAWTVGFAAAAGPTRTLSVVRFDPTLEELVFDNFLLALAGVPSDAPPKPMILNVYQGRVWSFFGEGKAAALYSLGGDPPVEPQLHVFDLDFQHELYDVDWGFLLSKDGSFEVSTFDPTPFLTRFESGDVKPFDTIP